MTTDAPHDLTMAGHAKTLARSADALAKELSKLTNSWRSDVDRDRELAWMIAQLADIVAELAKQQEAAQRRLTAGCSDRGGERGQLDGPGAAVGSDRHVATSTYRKACQETYADCTLCEPDIKYRCRLADGHDGGHVWTKLADWEIELPGGAQEIDARSLETGEPVPVSVTVRKVADPLDEDDHRPRHDRDGDHWHKGPHGWTSEGPTGHGDDRLDWLADSYGPLTFCDCDDATIEAENGATD